jgi:hypothetical protein
MTWAAVLAASAGCFLLKLVGQSVPTSLLGRPRVQAVAAMLPVALLAALVVVQAFVDGGGRLVLDARAAGLAAGVTALLLRAPFLVVVVAAAGTAALLRATGLAA